MFSLPSLTQKLAISKASFLTPIRQLGALGYLKPHEGSTFNYKNWVVVNHQVRGKQQDVGKKVKRLEVKFHGGLKGSNTILQTFPNYWF